MIRYLPGERPAFVLDTENTTYIISVSPSGHLEHLYYGGRTEIASSGDCDVFREKREFEAGNSIVYSKEHPALLLEDMCLEFSAPGHGDIREPFLDITFRDGSRSSDFLYKDHYTDNDTSYLKTLPSSYSENGETDHLCLRACDGDVTLELHYRVFPECDVITRSAVLINGSDETVVLERLMSTQIDIPFSGVCVTSFHGAWAREMNKNISSLTAGKFVVESRAGFSSNRANPFFMVHAPDTNEHSGSVYGFNLVYSGNHYSAVEVNAYGKTRIVSGIQPDGFRFLLGEGERFETPEAVMTFSAKGFTGQSVNMHRFVREHIVRGKWKRRPRPVLLNSWEACYFKISEKTLTSLAKEGKELGIELFVMDDGWFGNRNDDSHSLGDWETDIKKLPGGLNKLAEKINGHGMDFGIWVEPEMVNVESELYKQHPEWAIEIPGRLHSEGRNQRLLDLADPDVQDFIIGKMGEVFSSANVAYVKWDMNRIFSDVFSKYLPAEKQGETAHRYICGLYRVMEALTQRFPDILFEGCASGGNRFDLGILCYFPQIWASDNTDALCRAVIQEGYSYGYPQSCIGSHVSSVPNHQTLRKTPLETRFGVSSFGILGYELDVRDLKPEQKEKIKKQIELYKKWRQVFQFGQFYRVLSGNVHEWICVSQDKKLAAGLLMQELTVPNTQAHRFFAAGLDRTLKYKVYNIPERIDVKLFGSLINTVAPVHIKQDSLMHGIVAKVVKMNGESEDIAASGEVLMNTGVALKPAFAGTGFNDKVRIFPDFASRLYFFEAEDPEENG